MVCFFHCGHSGESLLERVFIALEAAVSKPKLINNGNDCFLPVLSKSCYIDPNLPGAI